MNEGLIALDPGISHRGVSSESPRLGRRNSQRATNFPTLRVVVDSVAARQVHSEARRRRPRETGEHVRRRPRVRDPPVTRFHRADRARALLRRTPRQILARASRLPRIPRRRPSSTAIWPYNRDPRRRLTSDLVPLSHTLLRREPCPHRIFDDIGGAFAMGAVGGGAVNLVKGFYNSPKGYALAGGLEAIRREAPKIGGSFAVWGGLFSAFDCTLVAIRRKEDPWNPIMSGALTGGVLQLRYGLASAGRSAAFGGFLLAVIEGISIMLTRVTAPQPPTPAMIDVPAATNAGPQISAGPQPTPTVVSADGLVSEGQVGLPEEAKPKGGFWGGIFGGGRKDDEDKTAAPAMPSFGGELK